MISIGHQPIARLERVTSTIISRNNPKQMKRDDPTHSSRLTNNRATQGLLKNAAVLSPELPAFVAEATSTE
jgi:hypothetical protein